jgi:hypothetical protein
VLTAGPDAPSMVNSGEGATVDSGGSRRRGRGTLGGRPDLSCEPPPELRHVRWWIVELDAQSAEPFVVSVRTDAISGLVPDDLLICENRLRVIGG